jgi:hypothetical protein
MESMVCWNTRPRTSATSRPDRLHLRLAPKAFGADPEASPTCRLPGDAAQARNGPRGQKQGPIPLASCGSGNFHYPTLVTSWATRDDAWYLGQNGENALACVLVRASATASGPEPVPLTGEESQIMQSMAPKMAARGAKMADTVVCPKLNPISSIASVVLLCNQIRSIASFSPAPCSAGEPHSLYGEERLPSRSGCAHPGLARRCERSQGACGRLFPDRQAVFMRLLCLLCRLRA